MPRKAKVVGAGIFGCTCARILAEAGFEVGVVEARPVPGGNCASHSEAGIEVHDYGSHIFHTDDRRVWDFVRRFSEFNSYRHRVVADHDGRRYFLPFSLPLLEAFFGRTFTPAEAREFAEGLGSGRPEPANLEEQAVSMVGRGLYEAFIRNYTAKQWRRDPKELDPSIIRRIPFRTTYDVDYFSDAYQGIPVPGYGRMFENMLSYPSIARPAFGVKYGMDDLLTDSAAGADVVYTGALDELFGYRLGELPWRSLRFRTETACVDDWQGVAVVNYVDAEPAYTRIHEFKHYHPEKKHRPGVTVIQREYPADWTRGAEKYYPVSCESSAALQAGYEKLAAEIPGLHVGGRLGMYRYMDMDDAVSAAMEMCRGIIGK